MILISANFDNNSQFPNQFRADKTNENPELTIQDKPANTASFALIMHDLDATNGGDFTHWLIWNIPADATNIPSGDLPDDCINGRNDFGNFGYGGPLPSPGTGRHHYVFDLYALDVVSNLLQTASRSDLEAEIKAHMIDYARLIGSIDS